MALKDSVWFPRSRDHAVVLAIVIIMVVLHHSELLGLMNAGLVFEWVPVQLAYDILYLFIGVIILYWIARIAPDGPEENTSVTQGETSVSTESVDANEE